MKDKNYKILTEGLNNINENEKFIIINKRIDEIVLNSSNTKETLQTLICLFEAKNNVTASFGALTIAYALLVGGASVLAQVEGMLICVGLILLVSALIVCFMGLKTQKKEQSRGFVLQVLKFRYENLQCEMLQTDEQEFFVKVKKINK